MKRVLFVCTHNSARSQMAEGLARRLGGGMLESMSAGIVASSVRPEAVEAMREIGIDISGRQSKTIEGFRGQSFDAVVTVCDGAMESCPYFPASLALHWSLEDPAAAARPQRMNAFRACRAELARRIEDELLPALGLSAGQTTT